jgi:NAD(P)-dependent dehydrogenase (short-subunit alcohol dehydrogenase family)
MSRTILVTGSASGIGAALVARLRRQGDHVIGADLHDAEIEVDLATNEGREALVEVAASLAPQGLDGVIAGAGVLKADEPALMVAVNYFGAVATLEGLRSLLARSRQPRGVLITSIAVLYDVQPALVEACFAGDEARAKAAAAMVPEHVYSSTKRALALWLRRTAVLPTWGGAGILLNAVAPGTVKTPMTVQMLATEQSRGLLEKAAPLAVDGFAGPDELAGVLAFLVGPEAHYLVGQVIFVDGGTDAVLRPEVI